MLDLNVSKHYHICMTRDGKFAKYDQTCTVKLLNLILC